MPISSARQLWADEMITAYWPRGNVADQTLCVADWGWSPAGIRAGFSGGGFPWCVRGAKRFPGHQLPPTWCATTTVPTDMPFAHG